MKKSFKLIGLDCANCAAKIEHAIKGLPDVVSISINFMTAKMFIEADHEKMDNLLVGATCKFKPLQTANFFS